MPSFSPDDITDVVSDANKLRKGLRVLWLAFRHGRLLPIFSVGAVACGLVGWSYYFFINPASDAPNWIAAVAYILIRTILSFVPFEGFLKYGNQLTWLGTALGQLATVTGAIVFWFATLHERVMRMRAQRFWHDHVVVIGDTVIAQRIAAEWHAQGERVLQIVAADAPSMPDLGPIRARLGTDVARIEDDAGLRYAKYVIVDLGSDTAVLSAGRVLMRRFGDKSWSPAPLQPFGRRRSGRRKPDTLALRVADPLLADQFFEVMVADPPDKTADMQVAPLRPTIFDENRIIARYVLSRRPLFKIATDAGQQRVHAVIVGFGDLGEKLLDQVMLTSIAGTLAPPRVTVLDRNASRRQVEFNARRPGVLGSLDIKFYDFDIGLHAFETGSHQHWQLAETEGVTAIFVAMPSDAETARTVLLLRRGFTRAGVRPMPIFYRWRAGDAEGDLLGGEKQSANAMGTIRMDLPGTALRDEIADPGGREALARAIHESYLAGQSVSQQAAQAWELLPDTLRRSNIRAADHLPAKLWSVGIDMGNVKPGGFPVLNSTVMRLISDEPRSAEEIAKIEDLARIEHERWMIDRKLDGWTYGKPRDNAKRLHPLIVPWEELKKSKEEVDKDVRVFIETLRFVAKQSRGKGAEAKVTAT